MIIRNAPRILPFIRSSKIARCSQTRIPSAPRLLPLSPLPIRRTFASQAEIDERIEEITELYATAKDEFDIASEETDKKTVYAADDRSAARQELEKLKTAYQLAINKDGGDEIRRRIGQRMRELDSAVDALEERAKED